MPVNTRHANTTFSCMLAVCAIVAVAIAAIRRHGIMSYRSTFVNSQQLIHLPSICVQQPWQAAAFTVLLKQQHPSRVEDCTLRSALRMGSYEVSPDEGFGSVFATLAHRLGEAWSLGQRFEIDVRSWSFGGTGECAPSSPPETAPWDCVFLPISSCARSTDADATAMDGRPRSPQALRWTGGDDASLPAVVATAGGTSADWSAALLAFLFAHLRPQRAMELRELYGDVAPGKVCIGVHLRLTDRGGADSDAELEVTWAGFAAAIRAIGDTSGADCVLVATDADPNDPRRALDKLIAASLTPRFHVRRIRTLLSRYSVGLPEHHSGGDGGPQSSATLATLLHGHPAHRLNATLDALAVVDLLSRCAFIVGWQSSTLFQLTAAVHRARGCGSTEAPFSSVWAGENGVAPRPI